MSLKELSVIFSDYVWTVDKNGLLNVTGPNHKLSWGPASKYAYTNGGKLPMAAAPMKKNGEWFYPLKSLSAWAGGKIVAYPGKEIGIEYTPLSMVAGDPAGWYWVRRDNGIVYTSKGGELPHSIGWSNVQAYQYYGMGVIKLEEGGVLLKIAHGHGEPSLGTDLYALVIRNGKLASQTAERYYGFHPTKSIDKSSDGYYALLNGTKAVFLDRKGNQASAYDMAAFLGGEGNFTLEYAAVDEGIALVRPYQAGMLLLVDLKNNKAVPLYKQLLSDDEQKLLESWGKADGDYPTDRLTLVKREGNTFTFTHQALMGQEKQTMTYNWDRG
ncbi:hypothetical protein OMP38_32555 [Cohnella ginsengisoli]|uniref:WG repeat-containing protein n=1 Tax=Cohnella ginsengisoli TaxID=425004 RepID=A0A9X4QQK7_9BACL|nr:hypothetical protein [Cohnella ginsengisoli]MDG0795033.1 hypothetical protein [Cohnella ginsengisoli]